MWTSTRVPIPWKGPTGRGCHPQWEPMGVGSTIGLAIPYTDQWAPYLGCPTLSGANRYGLPPPIDTNGVLM